MTWDAFFHDLEGQLAQSRAAELAAHTQEEERLRIARLALAGRLRAAAADKQHTTLALMNGSVARGTMTAVGADWCAVDGVGVSFVPFAAIRTVTVADVRRTLLSVPPTGLAERVTFGFVLRDLARRRVTVSVHLSEHEIMTGTIDRACADHCDIARHDAHTARRESAVRDVVIVPFAAIDLVHVTDQRMPAFVS